MITIEKSNEISKSLEEFYKAILPSESYQRRKNMQIMATEEDSFHRNVSKPFLDYMRLKIIQDIRRAVIKAKTTPTIFTEFVNWEDIGTKGKQLSKPAYVKVLDKSGTQAAVIARVEAGFDVMNVNSIKWAEKYSAGMVTQVTNETKKALREVITDGMKHKYNKLKIARQINKMPIGLNLKQTQALHNFRDKIIADGASAKLVEKRVQSYYNRLLRQRSRSIARTETSRAVNEGYLQGLEQQNVYRRVKISMAADACHLCTEHEGRIFTLEEAHAFLPIHPYCRCAWVVVYTEPKGRYRVMTPQRDKIDDFEAKHGGEYTETAYVVDDTGKVILEKEGGRGYVEFTPSEYEKITGTKNAIFTHTHPGNCSFSGGDMSWLADMDLTQEMRVAAKNYNYSVKMTKKTIMPPSRSEIVRIHNEIGRKYHAKYKDMFQGKIDEFRDAGMKAADAKDAASVAISELHIKEVNKEFVKMFNLKFKRTKRL